MARKSTTMVQDGTQRLVHLIRTDEGLYTFKADALPTTRALVMTKNEAGEDVNIQIATEFPGFEVDLTQAVMQAMRAEIRERSKLYVMACTKAEADRAQAGAVNAPMNPEEVAQPGLMDRLAAEHLANQATFAEQMAAMREELTSLREKVDRRGD